MLRSGNARRGSLSWSDQSGFLDLQRIRGTFFVSQFRSIACPGILTESGYGSHDGHMSLMVVLYMRKLSDTWPSDDKSDA